MAWGQGTSLIGPSGSGGTDWDSIPPTSFDGDGTSTKIARADHRHYLYSGKTYETLATNSANFYTKVLTLRVSAANTASNVIVHYATAGVSSSTASGQIKMRVVQGTLNTLPVVEFVHMNAVNPQLMTPFCLVTSMTSSGANVELWLRNIQANEKVYYSYWSDERFVVTASPNSSYVSALPAGNNMGPAPYASTYFQNLIAQGQVRFDGDIFVNNGGVILFSDAGARDYITYNDTTNTYNFVADDSSSTTTLPGNAGVGVGKIFVTNSTTVEYHVLQNTQFLLSGGEPLSMTNTGLIKWNSPLVAFGHAKGVQSFTDATLVIPVVSSAVVAVGYGSAASITSNAAGAFTLLAGRALWYEPPWGLAGNTAGTFRVTNINSGTTWVVPSDWIFVCGRSPDGTYAIWGTGETTYPTYVLSLSNSWVAFGGDFITPGYYKRAGSVYLQGLIRSGTFVGSVLLCTMPVGYRPAGRKVFAVPNATAMARVDIFANGEVKLEGSVVGTSNNTWLSLDPLSYVAEG